jgi:hypothetical protein
VSRFLATAHPLVYLAGIGVASAVAVIVVLWRDDLADQRRRQQQANDLMLEALARRRRHPSITATKDFEAWERENGWVKS